MGLGTGIFIELTGSVLLFCLVFGMSATVDIESIKAQVQNRVAILTGLGLQFVIMPVVGYIVVKLYNFDHPTGIILLVVTSSPGGSFSNWWCSLFNADLALSVTITAISTLVSTVFLPLNLFIYARLCYNEDVVKALDWSSVFLALFVVIAAVGCGLWASAAFHSHDFNLRANWLGSASGVILVIFSAIASNTDANARVWNREWQFYFGVATPCLVGLLLANLIARTVGLRKPERITVSVETSCQNVGVGITVALSMFYGSSLAQAASVTFYYGMVQAFSLLIYCYACWKLGYTKAPPNVPFWKMLFTSYEILALENKSTATPGEGGGNGDDDAPYVVQSTDNEDPDLSYCYVQHDDAPINLCNLGNNGAADVTQTSGNAVVDANRQQDYTQQSFDQRQTEMGGQPPRPPAQQATTPGAP